MSQEKGWEDNPTAHMKAWRWEMAWIFKELQSFRTSGRCQSERIKPEVGDQGRTKLLLANHVKEFGCSLESNRVLLGVVTKV